jgi:leader peptidase (prepilin peptidase) / N-methyltransferase
MPWFELYFLGLSLVLGASIGSFLNVVVYRLPAGLSLLKPPSRCPNCYTRLSRLDNIPIFGWLLLQGECRYCGTPISLRYPLIELVTSLLFGLAFWIFGYSWMTVGAFALISWLIALALIDLDLMILPNPLTQWGLISGLFFHGCLGMMQAQAWIDFLPNVLESLFSAVLGLLVFDALRIVGSLALKQDAMGRGDAKLAALIGAWLGWKLMLLSTFLACLLGSVIGIGGILLGFLGRRQAIPFGPYLALGALVSLFVGQSILDWYFALLGI